MDRHRKACCVTTDSDSAGADVNEPGEHLPIIKSIRRHRENDLSYIEYLIVSLPSFPCMPKLTDGFRHVVLILTSW